MDSAGRNTYLHKILFNLLLPVFVQATSGFLRNVGHLVSLLTGGDGRVNNSGIYDSFLAQCTMHSVSKR